MSKITRFFSLGALVILAASPLAADTPHIVFRPAGTPVAEAAPARTVPTKLTRSAPAVVLPYYVFDPADPSGVTTFFSVRNRSAEKVTVRYQYNGTGDGPLDSAVVEIEDLAPRGVRVVDVRTVDGVPSTGYMVAEVVHPQTRLSMIGPAALAGDYFRLDAANAFASGGPLLGIGRPLDLSSDLCRTWELRFLNGGGFDGGTRMAFYVTHNPGGDAPIVSGDVYSQSGEFQGVVEITTSDYAFEVSSLDLDLPVSFGAIEWVFAVGVLGHVSGTFDAGGLYSVGLSALCGDEVAQFDPASLEGAAADVATVTTAVARATYVVALLTKGFGASLEYDQETGWWIAALDLPNGQGAELRLQLLDASGQPQRRFGPAIETIRFQGQATGNDGSLALELVLSGFGAPTTFLVEGNGTATYRGRTTAVTVEGFVVPKLPLGYPESGTITVTADGVTVTVTFDGTQFAEATYTAFGITQTFLINLATGEIIPA